MTKYFIFLVFLLGCNNDIAQVAKKTASKADTIIKKGTIDKEINLRWGMGLDAGIRGYTLNDLNNFCRKGNDSACGLAGDIYYKDGFRPIANVLYKTACLNSLIKYCYYVDFKNNSLSDLPPVFYRNICGKNPLKGCPSQKMKLDKETIKEMAKYEKICQKKNVKDCFYLAQFVLRRGEKERSVGHFAQACVAGMLEGCLWLGVINEIKGEISEARFMFSELCYKSKFLLGCFNLGIFELKQGRISQAKKALGKACSGKYKNSCKILLEISTDNKTI